VSALLDPYPHIPSIGVDMIFRPQGVGMGRKPALWMKNGDHVEVSLEGVGSCVNRVVYDKLASKL
jgi:hypothetical protein